MSLLLVGEDVHTNKVRNIFASWGDVFLSEIDSTKQITEAFAFYEQKHPDCIILSGCSVSEALSLANMIRASDGKRHTGLIFEYSQGTAGEYEKTSIHCLQAGFDDVWEEGMGNHLKIAKLYTVLRYKNQTDELRAANYRLHVLSLTDDLTGIANMRGFSRYFAEVMRLCRDGLTGLGILMMDLDDFKRVNDTNNHLVGSYVLSSVGRLLRDPHILPKKFFPARYGGDEFIVLIPTDNPETAVNASETVRKRLEKIEFHYDEKVCIKTSGSFGVAWVAPGFAGPAEDVIKAADMMLYRAKEAGRNQTCGMTLRYPINFERISRSYLIEGYTGEEKNRSHKKSQG